MAEQSGKLRALRVRLDYHKYRGLLYWSRWGCALLALIVSGGYGLFVLCGVFSSTVDPSGQRSSWLGNATLQVSTGPLSKVHAHFESDCQQCHPAGIFQSIGADTLKFNPLQNIPLFADKCQRCHAVQSHTSVSSSPVCRDMDQNCSSCHQDHRGRDVRLTAIANTLCTNCHADLSKVCSEVSRLGLSSIDRFSNSSHAPQSSTFKSLKEDPGRIRFSHAQHLNPGQIKTGRRGGFEYAMLTPRWQKKTGYTENSQGLVQLTCSDCHKLQAPSADIGFENFGSLQTATAAERANHYAPIQFDQHCAACHQSTFAGQTTTMLALPHAAPREEVRQLLSAKLSGGKISGSVAMPKDQALLEGSQPPLLVEELLVEEDLNHAVERVFAGCAKCHLAEDLTDENIERALSDNSTPMIPQSWLQYGLFDHAAHQKIFNCAFCHEIPTDESSQDNSIVMIKGPESCTPCHRDALSGSASNAMEYNSSSIDLTSSDNRRKLLGEAAQPSVASDNCVLCHRYHWSRPTTMASGKNGGEYP